MLVFDVMGRRGSLQEREGVAGILVPWIKDGVAHFCEFT